MPRRGDGLYRRKNGTWVWDVWIAGKRHTRTFDRALSREEARGLAGDERGKIVRGIVGIRKPRDIGFDAASDLFLEDSRTNPKKHTVRYHEQCIAKLREEFGSRKLSEITTFTIETYKRRRSATARVRANREVATLKAIYNRMIDWKKYEGTNPAKGVKLNAEPRRRLRYLDEDEETRLLSVCSEPLRTILILGIHCGLRIEAEALPLLWDAVDLRKQTVTVTSSDSKTHRERTVPLNDTAVTALRDLADRSRCAPGDPAFVNRNGQQMKSVRTIFEKAREKAGLGNDVGLHTMRHTFASRLVMAGESLRTVQILGGWQSLRMLERYAHLSDDHLRAAVGKLDGTAEPAPNAVGKSSGTPVGNLGESRGKQRTRRSG